MKTNWTTSKEKLQSTKYLAIMAILIALKVVTSMLFIPVAENLHIGFTYLIIAIEAMILGPAAGMVSAFVTDIVAFLAMPKGPFFIGYTLSSMLTMYIYALCFYNKKITLPKIILAKTLNNYLVNVLLGSLWTSMLYSKGYYFYFTKSLIKNSIMLPIEIAMLYITFKVITPILKKKNLI